MKNLTALGVLAFLASTGMAAACPSISDPAGATIATTGEDLWSPNSYAVAAGGNIDLAACPSVPGTGMVIAGPDFEFDLSGLAAYNLLQLRVVGDCDTVLLVNDSMGQWHFSDDFNGAVHPVIDIVGATDGVFDVWVGTYGSELCNAELTLETF
ncbi:hypothetical protein [Roseicyclus marinus]|uniref:hypothetical protein n=1 Tax=Roseicyclus marinus TaxID=2161673 RepID=UPI00240FE771|nr:hypothetical protein [Roseicyclus marinus]MDG3039995.1 hypothetical protein [Roseicyclus marinus]